MTKHNYSSARLLLNRLLWTALCGVPLCAFILMMSLKFQEYPPLHTLMSPGGGYLATALPSRVESKRHLPFRTPESAPSWRLSGLKQPVSWVTDQNGVSHVLAQNLEDLFFAQGYVVASERLWQMDMITRAASGRLSEVLGERGLARDLQMVSLGLRDAAKKISEKTLEDPFTGLAVRAYTRGVNAWISELKRLPMEYQILDFEPGVWTEERSAELFLAMAFDLSVQMHDLEVTKWTKKWGRERSEAIYPMFAPTPLDFLEGTQIAVPMDRLSSMIVPRVEPSGPLFLSHFDSPPEFLKTEPEPGNGSNNWAVLPRLSESGKTLVANDTHLGLSLPSVWYEMGLHSPELSVYGATFAGAPGVMIGWTPKVAWAVTNAALDVVDWYEIELEGSFGYRVDSESRDLAFTRHEIKIRGKEPRIVELSWTDFGVIVDTKTLQNKQIALTFNWLGHYPRNSLKSFLNLNFAKSFQDCEDAVAQYEFPAQNFLCADAKNISLTHAGQAIKRTPEEGRRVRDGTKSTNKWNDFISIEDRPQWKNPSLGFVYSANEAPFMHGPTKEFFNWRYEDPHRSRRLLHLLSQSGRRFTVEDFSQFQSDAMDMHACDALPVLMTSVSDSEAMESLADEVWKEFKEWRCHYDAESRAAALYSLWWDSLKDKLWKRLLYEPGVRIVYPFDSLTLKLIRENDPFWFDDPGTPELENSQALLRESFHEAAKKLRSFGSDPRLADVNRVQMDHLLRLPALEGPRLRMGGCKYCLNALRFSESGPRDRIRHGPSWRMVVEIGEEISGYTRIPGGPSGNRLSDSSIQEMKGFEAGQLKRATPVRSVGADRVFIRSLLELLPSGYRLPAREAQEQ